ncbi:la-related protein 6-like [Morphnus guianensis]
MPDRQLVRRVVSQVEFHLSDENLAKDAFLLKHVQKNKMGFVSIKLLTSLKKVEYLTHDWWLTLYALQFSELLEVNEEGTKVGTIASIRILRPGRKLPSDVRKYTSDFPELLSKHCALVEYKSLGSASALRSLEDLGRQSCPCETGTKNVPESNVLTVLHEI